jgi:hypothetical protein
MQQVTVVNMVQNDQSDEAHQDSEPNLTVNLANPRELAGTAFTPDPASGPDAPIYVSADGGNTWSLNPIVPYGNNITGTYDITLRFASTTNNLYLAYLRVDYSSGFGPTYPLDVVRTSNYLGPAQAVILEEIGDRDVDQPFIQAATVPAGPDAGKDRIYVGYNDLSAWPPGRSASLDVCLDVAAASPVFTTVRLEHRDTSGQDGPQVRTAIHPDGTVYAAYYGWRATTGLFGNNTLVVTDADLVLVRDDDWGQGPNPFTALVDGGDGVVGQRVVGGISFPFELTGNTLGQQRVDGDISIAVDPGNSSTVYLAWADIQPVGYTLHLRRSTDRGVTWSPDLLTIENATNSSLAVTSQGIIGLLYQQLEPGGGRWNTHLMQSPDEVAWHDDLLATTPADIPVRQFDPYLGDYAYLTAADRTFYGVFCANNTPDPANFPNGVVYQRNHDFTARTLLGTDGSTRIAPSIDPFFFTVVPDPCRALEDQVAALEDEISTLIDALASGEIPPPPKTAASIAAVRAYIRKLERELPHLNQRLQQCRSVHPDPP